jgi:outer membrane protein OmpA-like peptidoglycan-associated protein
VLFGAVVWGLASWGWAQPSAPGKEEKKHLSEALDHLKYEEYRAAVDALQKAYALNPGNIETNYYLGIALHRIGLKGHALKYFEAVLAQDSAYRVQDLTYHYAQCLHHTLQLDKATKYYRKHQARYKPNSPEFSLLETFINQCRQAKALIANPVDVEITNLGPNVNSRFPDFGPVVAADESRLYFTTRRKENGGAIATDGLPYEDIWYSTRAEDGTWEPAKPIGPPINSPHHDATVSLSLDGRTIYFYRDVGQGNIYRCLLRNDHWTEPVPEGKPVQSKYREPSASLSPDGKTLYFTSDRPGGLGGLDIYYTRQGPDQKWGEPVNMGPTINTPFDEDGPFIHPDGRTLYFSSRGHTTMGGYDIFKTVYDKAAFKWSVPQNLGYPINTPDDDIYFTLSASGQHGYYASAREGSLGDKDIYRITFRTAAPPQLKEIPVVPQEMAVGNTPAAPNREAVPRVNLQATAQSLVLFKGTTQDLKTQKPVPAQITIVELTTKDTLTVVKPDEKGNFMVALPGGGQYAVYAESDRYLFYSDHFTVPDTSGFVEVNKAIELQPYQVGSTITLANVMFDFDKATIRPISIPELEKLRNLLRDNPRLRVKINGHTDNVGGAEYNQKLSEARAKAIVEWLIQHKINRTRLEYEGYGLTKPVEPNTTPAGRARNRRTEFEILDN